MKMYASLACFLLIHALHLYGMFDVYFKSPIVPDLPPVPTDYQTPAKRLVLFIGDGLRADHFYNTCHVPFLRELVESGKAVSGISHTRVPTESRPGTVAIAAGVYEDPSAVFKGWQHNPVPIDSFFNRCAFSFAWGSPDIVHLFSKDSQNVNASSYDSEDQNFNPDVSLSLNEWVLTKFLEFVKECNLKKDCRKVLYGEKISFFFHFLGIDMAGHKSKPYSESYIENIRQVDGLVKNLTFIFDQLFPDGNTAFVFTADHGMTDWGSHGAGSLHETKTPIVAWGPGVKSDPTLLSSLSNVDLNKCQWSTPHDSNFDVKQADIAVLMSTLLGVEIPTNNLGTVPVNFLSFDDEKMYSALKLNARQLLVLYHHLERHIKDQVLLPFFRPHAWSASGMDPEEFLSVKYSTNVQEALKNALVQIEDIKHGIDYYQNYFQNYLLFLLSMSFFGLILVMFGNIYIHSMPREQYMEAMEKVPNVSGVCNLLKFGLDRIFLSAMAVVTLLHFAQRLPGIYYIYAMVPLNLWWKGLEYVTHPSVQSELKKVTRKKWLMLASCGFISIELLHLSFFYRWLLSVIMVSISSLPFFLLRERTATKSRMVPSLIWTTSSVILSVFPLLPTVGVEKQTSLVLLSGFLWLVGVIKILMKSHMSYVGTQIRTPLTRYQIGLIVAALCTIIYVDGVSMTGTNALSQAVSWGILGTNFILLIYLPVDPKARLFNLAITFGIPFMMLSVSFESLFLPLLSVNMLGWTLLEPKISLPSSSLTRNEIRKGFYFLFMIIFSFFGIGNIDSVNSFDINWVRCFIGTFSPFTMTALIILKTIMPFFLVSCSLRLIVMETKADPVKILLIAMILCEAVGLLFLFKVQNSGSWLDIGRSISHYVIMEVSAFAIVILYAISGFFIDPTKARSRSKNSSIRP